MLDTMRNTGQLHDLGAILPPHDCRTQDAPAGIMHHARDPVCNKLNHHALRL